MSGVEGRGQRAQVMEPLANWVAVSEFGLEQSEKLHIGCDISWRLAGKILVDLEFMVQDFDAAGRPAEGLARSVDTICPAADKTAWVR